VKYATPTCQDSVEIKHGHATSTFLLNKKRGVIGILTLLEGDAKKRWTHF